jgi:glucokinase-like ROK family protein
MTRARSASSDAKGPKQLGSVEEILGSSQVRAQHSALILRLLWRTQESSRADLSRRTGLSRSTVSAIVSELLDTGLIHETRQGVSRGGRKPIVLAFADDASALVGVDLGATHVEVVVTNLRAKMRASETRSCRVRSQPQAALAVVRELIDKLLKEARVPRSRVLGIGVGVPSPVHPERPGELPPLILPKWKDVDLLEELKRTYGVPVFIENDANLGALGEAWWGAGRTASSLAFIKVAYGVGSGLIIDGRIHRGRDGTAGEIGHTSLDPGGPQCVCGQNGCINTLIGTQQLLDLAKARAGRHKKSTLAARKRLMLEHLVTAAQEGDPLAADVLAYAGEVLGTAIANLLNLLAPEVIVLGGSLTRAGPALLDPLERTVRRMSLVRGAAFAELRVSRLEPNAIALGAATLALEAALDDPRMFLRKRRASA